MARREGIVQRAAFLDDRRAIPVDREAERVPDRVDALEPRLDLLAQHPLAALLLNLDIEIDLRRAARNRGRVLLVAFEIRTDNRVVALDVVDVALVPLIDVERLGLRAFVDRDPDRCASPIIGPVGSTRLMSATELACGLGALNNLTLSICAPCSKVSELGGSSHV